MFGFSLEASLECMCKTKGIFVILHLFTLMYVAIWILFFRFCQCRTIDQNTYVAIYLFRICVYFFFHLFIFAPWKMNGNNLNRTCVRIGNNGRVWESGYTWMGSLRVIWVLVFMDGMLSKCFTNVLNKYD